MSSAVRTTLEIRRVSTKTVSVLPVQGEPFVDYRVLGLRRIRHERRMKRCFGCLFLFKITRRSIYLRLLQAVRVYSPKRSEYCVLPPLPSPLHAPSSLSLSLSLSSFLFCFLLLVILLLLLLPSFSSSSSSSSSFYFYTSCFGRSIQQRENVLAPFSPQPHNQLSPSPLRHFRASTPRHGHPISWTLPAVTKGDKSC